VGSQPTNATKKNVVENNEPEKKKHDKLKRKRHPKAPVIRAGEWVDV